MTDLQLRWRLGLFAVISLGLFATLIVLFGSLPTLFKRSHAYTIRFTDAPGLRPGAPVRRSGVRVGEVTGISLNDADGKVRVRVDLDPTYTVRQSETPTLVVSLLGTDASIDFVPKTVPPGVEPDRTPIPPGGELDGFSPVSVSTLINRASEVVPTTQETLNDMRKSMKRLEEMAPLLEQMVKEYRDLGRNVNKDYPDLVKSLKSTTDDVGSAAREYRRLGENLNVFLQGNEDKIVKILDGLQKTIESLNFTLERAGQLLSDANIKNVTAILKNVREVSDDAPAVMKNIRAASNDAPSIAKNTDELLKEARKSLQRLDQTLTKAEAAMADIQKTTQLIGDRGPNITKNLDESLDKLNRTMTDVRELVRVIGQSDGTFKRILTDPSLYNSIDQTACSIAKLMPRLDRILKDLETFADKLAQHPESIGVGGVVRPGSGLKDPPVIGTTPR